MNRKREQVTIFTQLGALFGPVLKVAENPGSYDSDERTRIHARFCFDAEAFLRNVATYGRGEPGHDYGVQWHRIHFLVNDFKELDHSTDFESYCKDTKTAFQACFDTLFSIPVPIESAIHEAHTPFSTYCLVKGICSTAANSIIWIDRYFDSPIFHRYFVETPSSTLITIVTWPKAKFTQKKDVKRYEDFMDISKLFAHERGTQGYRLVTSEKIHARLFKCDSKMFAFGDSANSVGSSATFTISKLDSTPENHKQVDDVIQDGIEVFGVNYPVHP
jgi:hypothetical protein